MDHGKVEVESLNVMLRDLAARLEGQLQQQQHQHPHQHEHRWGQQQHHHLHQQEHLLVEPVQESNVGNFVLSEFGLREKKKKNVGVAESKSSKVEEQRIEDKKAIQKIFSAIGVRDKGVVS